eukprot:TRINITY_DN3536_c0_g1_i1.p1 TRINITY_DN3536_c0_g1~~TRINITY_DN3536_c0_g1_i1.p1  ORF type:complete len:132 (+),score=28.53 TRINITY_DN3536_c0_g1_i1:429-824(+)
MMDNLLPRTNAIKHHIKELDQKVGVVDSTKDVIDQELREKLAKAKELQQQKELARRIEAEFPDEDEKREVTGPKMGPKNRSWVGDADIEIEPIEYKNAGSKRPKKSKKHNSKERSDRPKSRNASSGSIKTR